MFVEKIYHISVQFTIARIVYIYVLKYAITYYSVSIQNKYEIVTNIT